MNAAAPAAVDLRAVSPEDAARARWYLTLAELFRAPPSADWLGSVGRQAPDDMQAADRDDTALGVAWSRFARACADADAEAVRDEYDAAFIGVGKAEVFLYGSWHLSGFLHERPLVELREHLALLGVARSADSFETEDHVAALCETMAWLIVAAPDPARSLSTQRVFFGRFLSPWYEALADAIEHSGSTDFYKQAGRLLKEFLAVERQAFDFDSPDGFQE